MDINNDALIVERLGDEAIVFDPRTDEVHHLNAEATQAFAKATDDVSRRNLLRGGLIVGGTAVVTSMLASTAASALSDPTHPGPLAVPFDLATDMADFFANVKTPGNTADHFTFGTSASTGTNDINFIAAPAAPTTAAGTGSGTISNNRWFGVTAIRSAIYESAMSAATQYTANTGEALITWNRVAGASSYKIYESPGTTNSGTFGLVATAADPGSGTTASVNVLANGSGSAPPTTVAFRSGGSGTVQIGPTVDTIAKTVQIGLPAGEALAVRFLIPAGEGVGSGLTLSGSLLTSGGTIHGQLSVDGTNLGAQITAGNPTAQAFSQTQSTGLTAGTSVGAILITSASGSARTVTLKLQVS